MTTSERIIHYNSCFQIDFDIHENFIGTLNGHGL